MIINLIIARNSHFVKYNFLFFLTTDLSKPINTDGVSFSLDLCGSVVSFLICLFIKLSTF